MIKSIVEKIDKSLTAEEMLDLQTFMDGDVGNLVYDEITNKTAKKFPTLFVMPGEDPEYKDEKDDVDEVPWICNKPGCNKQIPRTAFHCEEHHE